MLSNVLLKAVCYLKVCFFQNHNQTVLVAKPNQTVNETKPKSGPRGGACIDPINTGPLMSRSIQSHLIKTDYVMATKSLGFLFSTIISQ